MSQLNDAKIPLGLNVLQATRLRIEWLFEVFPHVCISFSGGKDSTVLFHLAGEIARRRKTQFSVLFIDWEIQFQYTIDHVVRMQTLYSDVISSFYWVALPLTTINGVSQFQPEWVAWERDKKWVRPPPGQAITDESYFPFYYYAMTFEEFVPSFSRWLSGGKGAAVATGMRAEESYKRYIGITSQRKTRYADDKPWTTAAQEGFYYTVSPLYDWKIEDIWIFNTRYKACYNALYDRMHQAGVPVRSMRVCEPFGPEQRRSLWLFHILEPETWGEICSRVSGAHSGALYGSQSGAFYALNKVLVKPEHFNWQGYAMFLLDSMPEQTAEHYRNKIAIYIKWFQQHGFPENIPDQQDKDLGYKDVPSWRRVCKMLLKNDYWCRMLSFSPNKPRHYQRYLERMNKKRSQWGIL